MLKTFPGHTTEHDSTIGISLISLWGADLIDMFHVSTEIYIRCQLSVLSKLHSIWMRKFLVPSLRHEASLMKDGAVILTPFFSSFFFYLFFFFFFLILSSTTSFYLPLGFWDFLPLGLSSLWSSCRSYVDTCEYVC